MCTHRLLSEKEVFLFIIRICGITEYLHSLPEKVIHLDLKPDNILINNGEVYLVDFGSAVCLNECGKTGGYVSPGYAAPEQLEGLKVGPASDIYALGRILEFLLEHGDVSPKTEYRLRKIMQRCGEGLPWNRITAVDILIKMLERVRDGETIKTAEPEHGRSVLKIAVIGLRPGDGATHVAVALAHTLARTGCHKVCLAEENDHGDIRRMLEMSAKEEHDTKTNGYADGVMYLTRPERDSEYCRLPDDCECAVFDLGSSPKNAMRILQFCDIRIVVGSGALWRRDEYRHLTKLNTAMGGFNRRVLLINRVSGKDPGVPSECTIPAYAFPYEPNPFKPQKNTMKLLEKAMK